METPISKSRIISSHQGEKFNILGHEVTVKMHSNEANDNYIFELISPPGSGVPPHVHKDEDEYIYIVEGEFEVLIGEQILKAKAGDYLNFLRNIPHGYTSIGNISAKSLWHVNPGQNFEDFFNELRLLPPGPPDIEQLIPIHERHNIKLLL